VTRNLAAALAEALLPELTRILYPFCTHLT
jgi:hypothetical protein